MRNIFLLPSKKKTNLIFRILDSKLLLSKPPDVLWYGNYRNIYITSDEEIPTKDGEWYFKKIRGSWMIMNYLPHKITLDNDVHFFADCRKVVLTSDPQLIKDGVQPIPDEFLEWYVENPSCEKVEVLNQSSRNNVERKMDYKYKIIIPKEEICLLCDTNKLIDGVCKECTEALCKPINFIEEEIKCTCKVHGNLNDDFDNALSSFKTSLNKKYDNTKWGTEKIIDLIQFLSMNEDFNNYSSVSRHTAKHFLEEFKKQ